MSLSVEQNVYAYYGGTASLTLGMAWFIAHRNHAILSATSCLPPPAPQLAASEAQAQAQAREDRRQGLIVLGMAVSCIICGVFIFFIWPHIKSQLVIDCISLSCLALFWIFIVVAAVGRLQSSVFWNWNNGSPEPALIWIRKISSSRAYALSTLWTAMIFTSVYYGHAVSTFHTIFWPLVLYGIKPQRYAVKRRLRWTILGCLYLVFLVVIIGLTKSKGNGTSPSKTVLESDPTEAGYLWPSEWIWPLGYPFWFAQWGQWFLAELSVALRFDAAQMSPKLGERPTLRRDRLLMVCDDGKIVAPVDGHQKLPRKPLFTAGFISLIATAILAVVSIPLLPSQKKLHIYGTSLIFFGVASITVPAGIAFWAWCTGKFPEWYNFDELAAGPLVDSDEKQAMDDVEKLLDAKQ